MTYELMSTGWRRLRSEDLGQIPTRDVSFDRVGRKLTCRCRSRTFKTAANDIICPHVATVFAKAEERDYLTNFNKSFAIPIGFGFHHAMVVMNTLNNASLKTDDKNATYLLSCSAEVVINGTDEPEVLYSPDEGIVNYIIFLEDLLAASDYYYVWQRITSRQTLEQLGGSICSRPHRASTVVNILKKLKEVSEIGPHVLHNYRLANAACYAEKQLCVYCSTLGSGDVIEF